MTATKQFLKFFYNATAWYSQANKSKKRFLNLGFEGDDAPELQEEDLGNASFINLYHEITREVDLANKSVLEVGCGRGGGAYYMAKYRQAAQVKGIDLSTVNITICNEQNQFPHVSFSEADATNFSFEDEQFDVIINLESSHCYKAKDLFFECVAKNLKSGGTFAYSDLFNADRVEINEEMLRKCGFRIEQKKDITAGVLKSIDINSEKEYPFTYKYPYLVPRFIKNINVYKGSDVYNRLESGKVNYLAFVLTKQ